MNIIRLEVGQQFFLPDLLSVAKTFPNLQDPYSNAYVQTINIVKNLFLLDGPEIFDDSASPNEYIFNRNLCLKNVTIYARKNKSLSNSFFKLRKHNNDIIYFKLIRNISSRYKK